MADRDAKVRITPLAFGVLGYHKRMNGSLADRIHPAIFEGVHERPPWISLVRTLRRIFSCTITSMVLRHSTDRFWNGKATSDAIWDLGEWNEKFLPMWVEMSPFPTYDMKPGRCYADEDLVDLAALHSSDFYRDVIVPTQAERFVCLCIDEPGGYRGWLYLARSEMNGRFTPQEQGELAGLIPALQSALHTYAKLMRLRLERDHYQDTLARIGIGTIILSDEMEILSLDDVANHVLSSNTAMWVSSEKLKFALRATETQFCELFHSILDPRCKSPVRAMKVRRGNAPALHLLLRKAELGRDYGSKARPAVVLFINDTRKYSEGTASQVLRDLFELTPTEALVASLVGQGHSIRALSEIMRVTEGTVRSHLKKIFFKVGVNRQAELVRLVRHPLIGSPVS